jgi:hypothetical protein
MMTESKNEALLLEKLNAVRADMDSRLAALAKEIAEMREAHAKRIAELERGAVLFEEHRQAWISLNAKLQELKDTADRDERPPPPAGCRDTDQEERMLAILFDMVVNNCEDLKGRLNSWGRRPFSTAMRLLAEAGFIRIDDERGERILATSLPKGDRERKSLIADRRLNGDL